MRLRLWKESAERMKKVAESPLVHAPPPPRAARPERAREREREREGGEERERDEEPLEDAPPPPRPWCGRGLGRARPAPPHQAFLLL
jgi:hypothetical protein